MKQVNEFASFAEAQDLLVRLTAEQERLTAEQLEIQRKLNGASQGDIPVASNIDRAKALIEGNTMPPNRAAALSDYQDRELEIRHRLELISQALRQQPERVEQERNRARAAAWASRDREIAGVQKAWDSALRNLKAAIEAEDALIADLISGGFGLQEPVITSPNWLNREQAKLALAH